MTRTLLTLTCCSLLFLYSCSGSGSGYSSDTTAAMGTTDQNRNTADTLGTTTATDSTAAATAGPGKDLIAKSDCLGCHKEYEKLVGPAYADVAKKYGATDENVSYLAGKIMKGGSGVWGTIPMTPHPAITDADAKEMAKYILSIK